MTASRYYNATFVCPNASVDSTMSDIVSGVLKFTFGILANKIRGGIAERLKDGDVTDEECRRLMVRELDDIKTKLDGLARKDLLSSLCFLQEGINGLYQSLLHNQLASDSNTTESTGQAALVETASSRDTGLESAINEAVVLINAITSLKIRSNDRFKSAIESFKLAREKATEAFCNEALSIEDRIQASQIRMMARILEKLEDPDASVSDCLQYLKQLHDIGAIQKIFSVLIDGGIESLFNETKRLDNASSVHLMNQILFDFARKFTKLPAGLFDWPMILFGKKSYHPLFGDYRLIGQLEDSGVQVIPPNPDFTFGEEVRPYCSAVNSEGNIVALTKDGRTFKIFKRSGESRTLCEVPREEHASKSFVEAMNIDAEDNIYVITAFQKSDEQLWSLKLFIFEKNGNKKLETPLPFQISSAYSSEVIMAINEDGRIAILDRDKKTLYIGNTCVKLNSFQVEKIFSFSEVRENCSVVLAFDGTKVVAAAEYSSHVYIIYTENGQLQSKFKIPQGHEFIVSVAINHVTKRILVKTLFPTSLLSFSSTGELIDSLCLESSEWIKRAKLTSHPNGPVALVGVTGAFLIQL